MRIAIDARILAHPRCGISVYVSNLVKNLLEIEKDWEIFLFSDAKILEEYKDYFASSRVKEIIFAGSKKEKKRWITRFLPEKLKELKIDLYHSTWNMGLPFFKKCLCVLTIHDLAPWIVREFKNKRKEIKYKFRQFVSAHLADRIIAVSYKSKEDIVRICKVKEEKIKVIYLGLDEEFKKAPINKDFEEKVLEKYKLKNRNYIVDPIGINHKRKNPLFALDVFREFLKISGYDFYLVFTGIFEKEAIYYKRLIETIRKNKLQEKVIIIGYLSTPEFKTLLSNAQLCLIPSLYEGFCLPILEAFFSGIPVVSSKVGAIPEVVDKAGCLMDSFNQKEFAVVVKKITDDKNLREELVKKGKERLEFFDWKFTVQKTLEVYRLCFSYKKISLKK
ncbi:MAG: hypothetical protein B6D55_03675 [Candidatus Omnitrophica bacterium 4484_70.2]|nr:MAG: hypothetical protein B6D55_03675 [Candidatus Omnitrophica bacterium 4484_70.2]